MTSGDTTAVRLQRLTPADRDLARRTFVLMAQVFEEPGAPLGDAYLQRLLARSDFWAIAAVAGREVVGGITAYTLPLTRIEAAELFIYDIAVADSHRRRGIGGQLIATLRSEARAAGIHDAFVPVDDDDSEAMDFYRALGGVASPVTFFTF